MGKKFRFFYRLILALIKKEWKMLFSTGVFLSSIAVFIIFFSSNFFNFISNTTGKIIKPIYIEAVVGKPETFNPLFSKTEIEKQINSLVFRSLVKISPNGTPEGDLVEKIEIKNDTEYTLTLRKNVFWQDGVRFTADDVIYTIQIGQNSIYQSEIELTFRDVEISKKDDYTVIFRLKEPFSPFLSALTVGIIPKHIPLNNYRPVGTGEFRFVELKSDFAILEGKKFRIKFQYYPNLQSAESAVKLGLVHGLPNYGSSKNSFQKWGNFDLKVANLAFQEVIAFFNLKDDILKEKAVRQALVFATPKESILSNGVGKKGTIASNSLPNLAIYQEKAVEKYGFNLDKANKILTAAGWILKEDFRYKENKKLTLKITTIDDPEYEDTAIKMRNSFKKVGADVEVVVVSATELKNQIVPNRDFQILLTSQLLGSDQDQYVLWHTTQIKQSNISGITSPKIDKLLEDGRKTLDTKVRAEKYQEFTRILLDEQPAIFLYYPSYIWLLSKRIDGVDLKGFQVPEDRFLNSDNWKIKNPFI